MIETNLSTLKIHKLTQTQYDRELAAGNIDENALYLTPDEATDLSSYATVEQLDAKADAAHNHDTSDITSGTLSSDRLPTVPISKGGTGATTAASALTNLGITATAAELNYCDGVTSNIQTQLDNKIKAETNSYVGSGTSGSSTSPAKTLTFSFVPKIVIIQDDVGTTGPAIWIHGTSQALLGGPLGGGNLHLTWNDSNKTLSWYFYNSTTGGILNGELGWNGNGITYRYIALG